MEYQINIEEEAEKDIILAKCYYKRSNQEKAFDRDFLNQITYLKANPFLFQIYYKDIRVIHFKNFLYSIHYIINDNVVFIIRVLHQYQYKDS